MLEMDQNRNGLRQDIVKEEIAIDSDGFVTAPEKPGLGIEIDEEAVRKYMVEDGEAIAN
jgi:L-alanine-DL-glutamate epimerase-like enolase superfamily enzyme